MYVCMYFLSFPFQFAEGSRNFRITCFDLDRGSTVSDWPSFISFSISVFAAILFGGISSTWLKETEALGTRIMRIRQVPENLIGNCRLTRNGPKTVIRTQLSVTSAILGGWLVSHFCVRQDLISWWPIMSWVSCERALRWCHLFPSLTTISSVCNQSRSNIVWNR